MCGNFGLLLLGYKIDTEYSNHSVNTNAHIVDIVSNNTNQSRELMNENFIGSSAHSNTSSHGVEPVPNELLMEEGDMKPQVQGCQSSNLNEYELISPLEILKTQTARTEFRGGQAGGISSLEYDNKAMFRIEKFGFNPVSARVRYVARKRYPLADDLNNRYKKSVTKLPTATSTISGHTRFATSSSNKTAELHPHEWVPFHEEFLWLFDHLKGEFVRSKQTVGIHITHNGDFDCMEAYHGTMVVNEVGCWLERVLHVANNLKGDSPKVAGCMDLLRVQGRWGAAARLAWIRCVLTSEKDVADGEKLSKLSPNSFPPQSNWEAWDVWETHKSKVLHIINSETPGHFQYSIKSSFEKEFINDLNSQLSLILSSEGKNCKYNINIEDLSEANCFSFLHHTVRGFLRYDLYNAVTEFLSRAKGSFGLQVHCTLEPAVVVIASKGQPMSIAFDLNSPIVLFGSEAEALAVPVYKSGKWLNIRIDLDSKGEIFRLGEQMHLLTGTFNRNTSKLDDVTNYGIASFVSLPCGLTIRSYSLVSSREASVIELVDRYVLTDKIPFVHKGKWDLVAADLAATPNVLTQIDEAWGNPDSFERQASKCLCENILQCMIDRISCNDDTIDLLIAGIEASLWIAEQFAADLKSIFPNINVSVISSNKILGFGDPSQKKVFFSGSEEIPNRRMTNTCVLLVCQSGQTFPSLHATRKMIPFVRDKLWILTGCVCSKMEIAIIEGFKELNIEYLNNRVFLNYSGNRPAEPSSVAVAATWHTMSHILLEMIKYFRMQFPSNRLIHSWDNSNVSQSIDPILMNLTDGCIDDIRSLLLETFIGGISDIVGYDKDGFKLKDTSLNKKLISQGKVWADHINETWNVLIAVGIYILLSVGSGVTLFVLIGHVIVYILRMYRVPIGDGELAFSLLNISRCFNQPFAWTLVAAILQIMDGIFFIYLAKTFTSLTRFFHGRPLSARFGKRTIVIVDSSCIHQLLENFVSKLYSQSYSFNSIEVHGANGLDHFVHRFTHRVTRGVLIAIGRPDGRLSCLAKSEASILLAAKQAAFIKNPDYSFDGSGPEFIPNLGLAKHIVIKHNKENQRRKFLDELIYERLHQSVAPHAGAILSSLAKRYRNNKLFEDNFTLEQFFHEVAMTKEQLSFRSEQPLGVQHIDSNQTSGWFNMEFYKREIVRKNSTISDSSINEDTKEMSCDPSVRLAFFQNLDEDTKLVQERQVFVQQIYECRIASLERYLSFCVMFHAMAERSCKPWFRIGWDIARSQSNLRVATTACPIAAKSQVDEDLTKEIKLIRSKLGYLLRKVRVNF